jgi:hypothetical protein
VRTLGRRTHEASPGQSGRATLRPDRRAQDHPDLVQARRSANDWPTSAPHRAAASTNDRGTASDHLTRTNADFDDKMVPGSPVVAFGQTRAAQQSRDYLITRARKVLSPVDLALRVVNGRNVVGRDWLSVRAVQRPGPSGHLVRSQEDHRSSHRSTDTQAWLRVESGHPWPAGELIE